MAPSRAYRAVERSGKCCSRAPSSGIQAASAGHHPGRLRGRYEHTGTAVSTSGMAAHEVLPAVHRVFSLVKRWLMGTMQGSGSPEHMQAYFHEWVFRFNRRSAQRGLLFHTLLLNAAQGQLVTYESLRKTGRTRPAPTAKRITATTPSLDVERTERPWRT